MTMSIYDGADDLLKKPFPTGKSPFRVKGNGYRGHMDYVAEQLPGGLDAMLEAMPDDACREFFKQPFLAGVWYDVFPLAIAGVVCGKLVGKGFLDFTCYRTGLQADRDVNGIYRVLLKLATPDMVAARLPKLVGRYFDFGSTDLQVVGAGHASGFQRGMPRLLAPWYIAVIRGYAQVTLRLAGAKESSLESGPPEPDGEAHGLELVRLAIDYRWK